MKPFLRFAPAAAVSVLLALSGCAALRDEAGRARAQPSADAAARSTQNGAARSDAARARAIAARASATRDAASELEAEPPDALPAVELTPQILYQLLASEVAVQRGQASAASASYLALARQTRDPRIARRAVELALAERSLERASGAAQLWLETAPSSKLAAQTLETLYLTNGQYSLAEPLVTARLAQARASGGLADAYSRLARVLPRTPDRTAAYALIERVAAPDEAVPEAWLARAAVASVADDTAAAAQAARRALALAPDSEEAAVAAARYAQRLPEGNAAGRAVLSEFLARQPEAHEARFALGRLYAADGDHARARAQFERVLADEPDNPATLFSLAQVAYQSKQPRDAERYLLRYVDLPETVRRDNVPAYVFLAQLAEDDKRLADAVGWLARVDSGEQRLAALVRRATLLGKMNRMDDARALLRDAPVSTNADRVQLAIAEAQLLRESGRQQDAFELLGRALDSQPDQPDLLYEHALTADRIGRTQLMESNLRKLIALRPEHAHAYNALGYSLADRGVRLPEALELIERARALAPDDAFILDSLGWVHFRMGNFDRAIGYLQKAYDARPEAEIAAHLGEVLWAAGRVDDARRLWREARGREPDNETLKGTLARLNVAL